MRLKGLQVVLSTLDCIDEEVEDDEWQLCHLCEEDVDMWMFSLSRWTRRRGGQSQAEGTAGGILDSRLH